MLAITWIMSMTMMKTVDPFKLSVILLLISISLSIHLLHKTLSTWTVSVIILTFSSGMMVLFCYSSSIVNLETMKKTSPKIYTLMTLAPMTIYLSTQPLFKAELWMKEFTMNMTSTLTMTTLILFMIPMMENCFFPMSPMQSTF